MQSQSVICTCSRIKEGHVDDVRLWLKTLLDRREETLESFQNENVWIESAFIWKNLEDHYLIYYMRADDVEKAMAVFRTSSLAIDHFHAECFGKYTEHHAILEKVFHLENLNYIQCDYETIPLF